MFFFVYLIYINCLKLLIFIFKNNSNPFFSDTSFIPHPIRAANQFYNLGEALLMAKYAAALVRLGFTLEQIGFIVLPFLDAQPTVLSCLLRHQFKLSDEELNKLTIGDEYDFLANNWRPREIIIRCSTASKNPVGHELIERRFAYMLIIIF